MIKMLCPSEMAISAYEIDYDQLYRNGFRGIILDIDNTLVPHGENASDESVYLINKMKNTGFNLCIISNNDEERVFRFNKNIGLPYVFKALKPSKKGYTKAKEILGCSNDKIICIGDQIFTDIAGANRAGMYSILVKPIDPKEPPFVRFKRLLEKPVFFYLKHVKINLKEV